MGAGSFDRRIRLERARTVDDGFTSGEVAGWSLLGEVWAEVVAFSDGERWRASQVQSHVTSRFRVRWSRLTAGLSGADRIVHEGRAYNIAGLKEAKDGRRRVIEITASAIT